MTNRDRRDVPTVGASVVGDTLVEKSKEQRKRERREEALISAIELRVLEALERLDLIEGLLLNRIGILHHQKQHFYKAIHYYKRYAALNSGPAGLFNVGLVFSEISQDADAIDCWRLCTKTYPEYSRANDALGKALPRMVALARRVLERKSPITTTKLRLLRCCHASTGGAILPLSNAIESASASTRSRRDPFGRMNPSARAIARASDIPSDIVLATDVDRSEFWEDC